MISKWLMDGCSYLAHHFNLRDEHEETPLCCASRIQTNTEVVRLLIERKAKVNPGTKVLLLFRMFRANFR